MGCEKVKEVMGHRWVVFVGAMWVQSFAGMAYMFGSISPVIKTTMGYNQKQLAVLATAKDLGDNIGFLAGKISQTSPTSRVLLVGALQNFAGYALLWLTVTHKIPLLPLWALCICIFVGTNAATYYNTACLVSCVKNFPENRGPVVGILKGFMGLSGAIMTQILALLNTPDQASLIFIIAVGPAMVSLSLMFIIRPLHSAKQYSTPSDSSSFFFIYTICLLLASYLMGVLMLENVVQLDQNTLRLFAIILIILILLPVLVPITLVFFSPKSSKSPDEEALLVDPPPMEENDGNEVIGGEVGEGDSAVSEGPRQIVQLQAKIFQAVTEAVRKMKLKSKNGPEIGEDFTVMEALVKVDLWLIFLCQVLGSGVGLTVINNMGQICQSLGDNNANLYVSVFSIFNFLGRVGGGYLSEVITRKFGCPRHYALAAVQFVMAIGASYYVMGWAGQLYVITILTGLGYGAHWSVGVAAASELFGLKNFGALYNFLTMATPTGSLILSGLVASTIYDYYAEQQANHKKLINEVLVCEGNICYSITCGILVAACLFAMVLSLIVVRRTKKVYAQLYGNSRT
ncbi:protein NUCLEAR FUSION DEFECTIVE 4 [Senna tora]|uniref:Protein NUCLEAR FUSION DEFECTIVE 4 n=1 Tax=Senna tora TaxID=362788 RepID=A0A834WX47_9FABA|nr:protein NUCLEAR FUSION DEFECTIVE 4 [Senna tora]